MFLFTHKHFIMFVDLMTPINQDVPNSLNILLLNVYWNKDTDPCADEQ